MHDTTSKVDMAAMNRAIDKVLAYGNPKPPPARKQRKPQHKRNRRKTDREKRT